MNNEIKKGDIFGELVFTGETKRVNMSQIRTFYKFKCSCGNETFSILQNIKKGKTRSCGCKRFSQYRHFPVKDKEYSVRGASIKFKICQNTIKKYMKLGNSLEDIVTGKYERFRKTTIKEGRKLDLHGRSNINEVASELGITKQRVYQKLKAGEKLIEKNGKLIWLI